MGTGWSAPPGRADVPSRLLPFTVWTRTDLDMMRKRHTNALGGEEYSESYNRSSKGSKMIRDMAFQVADGMGHLAYGIYPLRQEHFARLLGADSGTVESLFKAVFDTDKNGLVDVFEVMCAMALLCSASLPEKVDFAHSLFDFSSEGDLGLTEVTILLRTALIASQKLDGRVQVASTDELEALAQVMFDEAGVDYESDVAKHHFDSFVFRNPKILAFLQMWSGSVSQAVIPDDSLWEDPDFPADASSLYQRPGVVPIGLPPPEVVRWLRPIEVAGGDTSVLFVGDLPGDSPMVPGQLADQWLLSAMGILTGRPQVLRSLFVPTGQEDSGRYCVRIFKEANWVNVFVDTRVPCDSMGKPLFCHGVERHELWSSLLEKAFAKAHGTYENLVHGDTLDALRDLTGGIAEKLQWASPDSRAESGTTSNNERAGGAGDGQGHLKLTGWGLSAGSCRQRDWVFDTIRARLEEGQVLGCSRQEWVRNPWDDTSRQEEGQEEDDSDEGNEGAGDLGDITSPDSSQLFLPSNRLMRGLRSGVAYCVLEVFERGGLRLLRLKDPWCDDQDWLGSEPGQYLGDWGPSSPSWVAHRRLASELMPRTLPGMFWMDQDAFLEIFNTAYAVDLGPEAPEKPAVRTGFARLGGAAAKKRSWTHTATDEHRAASGSREGRCEGSWEGDGCGGRFTAGAGWFQGTQAFLQIYPPSASHSGTTESARVSVADEGDGQKAGSPGDAEDRDARVSITVTQEDSMYHKQELLEREERKRPIGFLVHTHKWSTEPKRNISKLGKVSKENTVYVTRVFLPRRDVSCRLSLRAGQYAVIPTTLEAGTSGRFWVHVKSSHRVREHGREP